MKKEVVTTLGRIPMFEGVSEPQMSARRLGGLTNRNYRIDCPSGRFVLRLAGEGTSECIDRVVEQHNARVAAQAGVNAEVLFFDASDGTMLCRYIDDSVTMNAERFNNHAAVARAALAAHPLPIAPCHCDPLAENFLDTGERMVLYKAMCDLLWTLWGVVQHANKNPAEDFWAYAVNRLERCKHLMSSDAFPRHIEAVNRGPSAT